MCCMLHAVLSGCALHAVHRAQIERACVERVDSSLHTLQPMRGTKESEWLVHMLGDPPPPHTHTHPVCPTPGGSR